MPVYVYEAVNDKGQEVKGRIEAESDLVALNRIRGLGYFASHIREEQKTLPLFLVKFFQEKNLTVFHRVKFIHLVAFTRQMATLIGAGMPILKSLRTLQDQPGMEDLKRIITQVGNGVERGQTFSEGLSRFPRHFSKLYVNMIRAGESGGILENILRRLADFLESQVRLKSRVKNALIYPLFVVIVAIGILIVLLRWVVPIFVTLYDDLGSALPGPTQILLVISDFMRSTWALPGTALFIVGFSFLYGWLKRLRSVRMKVDGLKLKMPLFGGLYSTIAITRFARTLGTLISSGVPILQALTIVRSTAGNEVIAEALGNIHDSIREGENISQPLRDSKIFPPLVVNMVAVGEETGKLDEMLFKVADNFDEEVERSISSLTALMEPVLIVFMGAFVAFIVIAMIMPLFSLIQLVG